MALLLAESCDWDDLFILHDVAFEILLSETFSSVGEGTLFVESSLVPLLPDACVLLMEVVPCGRLLWGCCLQGDGCRSMLLMLYHS